MALPRFTVDGDLNELVGDATTTLNQAAVMFTSNIPAKNFVIWEDKLFRVPPVKALVTADGIRQFGLPVTLLANDPGLSVHNVQWRVQIFLTDATSRRVGMEPFWFTAPADGATVDLVTVVPAPDIGELAGTRRTSVPVPGGVSWWYGQGQPATITGSQPGDYYMDTSTGTIFKLGD